MGVKGLWELLSPVGRRVSIETLDGKILAIDASIWITQFLKAMRDEEGRVVKNAHLIGTLRRILKLLFNKIRPVFVFDGQTPQLKIQTIRARRAMRERQEVNLKKVAEKILLAKMKKHILSKAAGEESSSSSSNAKYAPGFQPLPSTSSNAVTGSESKGSSGATGGDKEESESEEWEEGYYEMHDKPLDSSSDEEQDAWVLPDDTRDIDVDTLAALPLNMRKHVIEDARKREGRRKRSNYMPVASNPQLYSQTQVANFLRTSKLNQVIVKTQEYSDSMNDDGGRGISADGSRRYIYQSGPMDNAVVRCTDSGTAVEENTPGHKTHRRMVRDDDSDEDGHSPVEGGGFFIDEDESSRYKADETKRESEVGLHAVGEIHDGDDVRTDAVEEDKHEILLRRTGFGESEDDIKIGPEQYKDAVSVAEIGGRNETNEVHTKEKSSADWECLKCTFFNRPHETVCGLCGSLKESRPGRLPSTSSGIEEASSQPIISTSKHSPTGEVSEESDGEWEDNDYSDPPSSPPVGTDVNPEISLTSKNTLDVDLVMRAVSSASGMGDWAGRAVRKALQGRDLAPAVSSKSSSNTTAVGTRNTVQENQEKETRFPHLFNQSSGSPVSAAVCQNQVQWDDDSTGFMFDGAMGGYASGDGDDSIAVRRALRDTEGLTSEMVEDIKALLTAFDIPFITAPFEAEAQCAFLEQAGLVDGVVTEDSDVFLFGARCVYRHIFDEKRYVEAYLSEDIRRDLGVSRSDLIAMAYLLGSDYTEGVKGIGIVNAMEIVDVFGTKQSYETKSVKRKRSRRDNISPAGGFFSSSDGELVSRVVEDNSDDQRMLKDALDLLGRFKQWLLEGFDFTTVRGFSCQSVCKKRRRLSKGKTRCQERLRRKEKSTLSKTERDGDSEESNSPCEWSVGSSDDDRDEVANTKLKEFSRRHKAAKSSWSVKESFPDTKVAEAYLHPQVNQSTDSFSFKAPQLFKVRKYCSDIMGWTDDEITSKVNPVIKKCVSETSSQPRIDSFYVSYHDNSKFATIRSNRLRNAVEHVRNRTSIPTTDDSSAIGSRAK